MLLIRGINKPKSISQRGQKSEETTKLFHLLNVRQIYTLEVMLAMKLSIQNDKYQPVTDT
jgi:hypothetical protein